MVTWRLVHDKPIGPEELMDNLKQKREGFWEILVTAIIFGLTMNLISDVISSSLQQLAIIVAFLSLLATLLLLWFLIRKSIGASAKHRRIMKIVLMWNSETGEIASRETGYLPQIIAHTLFS